MAQPWRLPEVNGDDGAWGDILNQFLNKEHYNNDNSGAGDTASGGHMNITLRPGTTTAAPITFSSGTNLSTVTAGTMEYNGTSLFFSPSTTRYNIIMNGLGLSGGQNVIGGTGATDILKLQGTSANGTLTNIAIQALVGNNGGSAAFTVLNNTNVGFGVGMTAPTANVHIEAGSIAAGSSPIKLTSGSLMTTPETGAFEFLTDRLYFTQTTSTTRKTIAAYDDNSGATGDIHYRDSGGNFTRLAIGSTSGQIMTVNGGLPAWTTVLSGASKITVSTTAPTSPATGDVWINTT